MKNVKNMKNTENIKNVKNMMNVKDVMNLKDAVNDNLFLNITQKKKKKNKHKSNTKAKIKAKSMREKKKKRKNSQLHKLLILSNIYVELHLADNAHKYTIIMNCNVLADKLKHKCVTFLFSCIN